MQTIEKEINRLATLLNNTQSGCLIFAIYDTASNRDEIIGRLKGKLKIPIYEFHITQKQKNPLKLLQHLDTATHLAVSLYNIEQAFPEALGYINYQREALLNQNWGLIFWITEYGRNEIANKSADFWSLRSGVFDFRIRDYKQILELRKGLIAEPILYQSKEDLEKRLNLYQVLLKEYEIDNKPAKKDIAELKDKIGQIYYLFGDYPQSYEWLKQALAINEEIGNEAGLAATYNNIGKIYRAWDKYQEALEWYEKSRVICETMGDPKVLAMTYNNIGMIHDNHGNFHEALKWYEKSIKIKEEVVDYAGLAATYNNIASIHYAQGNFQDALKWHEKSIAICEKIGEPKILATTYNNIGLIHYTQGNYQEALKWYEKSAGIFKEIGSWHSVAVLFRNIGLLYRAIDEKDVARQYLQESINLYLQLKLESEAEEVRRVMG